jgi:hypothetical protein
MNYISYGPRVPTIVISPYARPGFVDHHRYDFASILRYIEDKFGLPQMSEYDRKADSIGADLDPQQTPLQPLTLKTRTCPPGAYMETQSVQGTVKSVIRTPAERAIVVQTADSPDPVRLVLSNTSVLQTDSGHAAPLSAVQPGDSVVADGVPSPDRALVYLGQHVTDNDLSYVHRISGTVRSLNAGTKRVSLAVSDGSGLTVQVTPDTSFQGAGRTKRFAVLKRGQSITVSGFENRRFGGRLWALTLRIEVDSSRVRVQ